MTERPVFKTAPSPRSRTANCSAIYKERRENGLLDIRGQSENLIMNRTIATLLVLVWGLLGGTSWAPAQTSSLPPFGHVFVVVEENHGYSQVVGSSSMPYLNSLISEYGLATD